MLRRRMATSVAATIALILMGTGPVFAQEEPNFEDFSGNATTCSGGQNPAGLDGEILIEGQGAQSDSTDDISGVVTDGTFLNVTVHNPDLVISGIVIKAGSEGYRVYNSPEPDMTAPPTGEQGNIPDISHWFVCGEIEEPRDENGEEPPGEEEEPPPGEEEEPPAEKPDEEPTDDKTPAPVPTAVPAGVASGDSENGAAGTIGLIAAGSALAVAAVVLVRRRFLHES